MERRDPGHRYVYGPVPSRRLGRSLGVDLVPFKTCTYDCVYCQLAHTTNKTVERRGYTPLAPVLAEIDEKLESCSRPDYISLAGSGEPTLQRDLGALIRGIRGLTDIPVAVITNGSLLWMEDLQEELSTIDLVLPSLDAGDAQMFERINRPHPGVSFERMVDGLASFTRRCAGRVWLEVMLVTGLNGTPEHVERIAALTETIRPARIQLNTVSRPPGEHMAGRVPTERLKELRGFFSGEVEVISDVAARENEELFSNGTTDDDVLGLLERRPCTSDELAAGLGQHVLDVVKTLERLATRGRVAAVLLDGRTVYRSTVTGDTRST